MSTKQPEKNPGHEKRSSRSLISRRGDFSLVDYVLRGRLRLPREYRREKSFFRMLRRAGADPAYRASVKEFRDSIIRASLTRDDQSAGMSVALSGPRGGEGTSLLSLLLALSLGSCKSYRVAYLDGRFNPHRFEALAHLLSLSRNSFQLDKRGRGLDGYHNKKFPNVYFLRNVEEQNALEFFSDKRLKSVMSELQQNFDFLVLDTPPMLRESSGTFVTPEVDKMYLVVQAGKTRLAELDKCRDIADDLGREFSGVVVNGQKAPLWSRLFWREYFF